MGIKTFLTGAQGGLAAALCPALKKQGYDVFGTDLNSETQEQILDICNYPKVLKFISETKPEWVFHLAAETDVDYCEKNPDHAFKTNTLGTENMALACRAVGAKMVYISTGGVFDGAQRQPYTEFDAPNPVNAYGRSKWEGEKVVQALVTEHFIFRAGWMVGGGKKDKKFVAKMVQLLKTQKELQAVDDKFGTPTFTHDMAKIILEVIPTGRYGVYHAVNAGITTRYEIAKKIVAILNKKDVTVNPVCSAYFPLPAPRAASEAMRNYKLDLLGLNTMPAWEISLEKYLRELTAAE